MVLAERMLVIVWVAMAAKDNGAGGKWKYDDSECNDLSLDVSLVDQLQEGKCAHCDLVIIFKVL